jgi:hypothetical protein
VPPFGCQGRIQTLGERAERSGSVTQQLVFAFELVYLVFALVKSLGNRFSISLVILAHRPPLSQRVAPQQKRPNPRAEQNVRQRRTRVR